MLYNVWSFYYPFTMHVVGCKHETRLAPFAFLFHYVHTFSHPWFYLLGSTYKIQIHIMRFRLIIDIQTSLFTLG